MTDSVDQAEATVTLGGTHGAFTLIGRDGRSWICECRCGQIETHRKDHLQGSRGRPILRCKTCDARPCPYCSTPVPRNKSPYCSPSCRARQMGLRQAEYYRTRIEDPAFRVVRAGQRRDRRARLTPLEREERRSRERERLRTLSAARKSEISDYQRRWYLENRERIRADRERLRGEETDADRAKRLERQREWHDDVMARAAMGEIGALERLRRKKLAGRRARARIEQEDLLRDIARLESMIGD